MTHSATASDDNLCIACGICCDGTMLNRVVVTDETVVIALTGSPMLFEQGGGQRWFTQPCAAFDGCCSVYASRPDMCREFKCTLLLEVERGDVSVEAARSVIDETIRARDRAVEAMRPLLPNVNVSFREMQVTVGDQISRETLDDVEIVNDRLARYFFPATRG
ncbi:MAG: YkgJ family cysteine cluster protein [Ilumatobacteraceae bacterium]